MNTRRLISSTFITIATVLILTGVAYACVPFKGEMSTTVSQGTGGGTFTNSGTHEGLGGTVNHKYCATGTEVTPGTAATAGAGNVLTITVSPGAGCAEDLGTKTHTVYLRNHTVNASMMFRQYNTSSWSFVSGTGCWAGTAGRKSLGTMAVSNGSGTGTYTLPNLNRVDPAGYASGLCVGDGSIGMIIPIVINDITV